MKRKKFKQKKVVYVKPKAVEELSDRVYSRAESEVKDLEAKREKVGSGFRGFLRKAALNKQINEKRQVLSLRSKVEAAEARNRLGKKLVEREKIKSELASEKQKRAANFEPIKMESLY